MNNTPDRLAEILRRKAEEVAALHRLMGLGGLLQRERLVDDPSYDPLACQIDYLTQVFVAPHERTEDRLVLQEQEPQLQLRAVPGRGVIRGLWQPPPVGRSGE